MLDAPGDAGPIGATRLLALALHDFTHLRTPLAQAGFELLADRFSRRPRSNPPEALPLPVMTRRSLTAAARKMSTLRAVESDTMVVE